MESPKKKIVKLDTSVSLESINARNKNTMATALSIDFVELTEDYLVARMPVNENTRQPLGMLNGGASLALAETVGSVAANLVLDRTLYVALGLDINGNHLRPATTGYVYGKALPIHIGRQTQVWQVEISDEDNKLINVSRLTMSVVEISNLR